jgi:NADPH-dependent curcumin reductase CurA
MVDKGELNIIPNNIYELENASTALENFLTRKNIGKTVINI